MSETTESRIETSGRGDAAASSGPVAGEAGPQLGMDSASAGVDQLRASGQLGGLDQIQTAQTAGTQASGTGLSEGIDTARAESQPLAGQEAGPQGLEAGTAGPQLGMDSATAQADAAVASSRSHFSWAEASGQRAEENLPPAEQRDSGGRSR